MTSEAQGPLNHTRKYDASAHAFKKHVNNHIRSLRPDQRRSLSKDLLLSTKFSTWALFLFFFLHFYFSRHLLITMCQVGTGSSEGNDGCFTVRPGFVAWSYLICTTTLGDRHCLHFIYGKMGWRGWLTRYCILFSRRKLGNPSNHVKKDQFFTCRC